MSRSRFPYDAALALQAYGSAALTATAASTGLGLERNVHKAVPSRIAYRNLAVVFDVLALDRTTGDETYSLTVEVATDAAFTTPVTVGTVAVAATGSRTVIIDNEDVELACPGAAFVRTKATLGGTTPSINYASRVAHDPV